MAPTDWKSVFRRLCLSLSVLLSLSAMNPVGFLVLSVAHQLVLSPPPPGHLCLDLSLSCSVAIFVCVVCCFDCGTRAVLNFATLERVLPHTGEWDASNQSEESDQD